MCRINAWFFIIWRFWCHSLFICPCLSCWVQTWRRSRRICSIKLHHCCFLQSYFHLPNNKNHSSSHNLWQVQIVEKWMIDQQNPNVNCVCRVESQKNLSWVLITKISTLYNVVMSKRNTRKSHVHLNLTVLTTTGKKMKNHFQHLEKSHSSVLVTLTTDSPINSPPTTWTNNPNIFFFFKMKKKQWLKENNLQNMWMTWW